MSAQRRIFVLAPYPPGSLPAHGGSVAIAALVTALCRRNRVALAYLRADEEAPAAATLLAQCEVSIECRRQGMSVSSVRPLRRAPRLLPQVLQGQPLWVASRWSAELAAVVRRVVDSWSPDIVQAESGVMGAYLAAAGGARTVVTFHDVEAVTSTERSLGAFGLEWLFHATEAALWRTYERRLLRAADASIALTERDATALSALDGRAAITRIPLGVTVPPDAMEPAGGAAPLLLFVGNFNHPPNVDAARFLLDDVLPGVRRRHPGAVVTVAGDGPPASLRARAGGNVRVPGFVADLEPLMRAATIVVAPLRSGGGMRVKVLEALAAGKAMVGTSRAFEGMGVIAGRHALIADDEHGFIESVARLLDDAPLRIALGTAARAHVTDAFSWDRTAAAYEAVYERVLARPAAR